MREGEKQLYCASINRISLSVVLATPAATSALADEVTPPRATVFGIATTKVVPDKMSSTPSMNEL
jgi:hypothetical protein